MSVFDAISAVVLWYIILFRKEDTDRPDGKDNCERLLNSEPSADRSGKLVDGSAIKRRTNSMVKQAASIIDQRVAHSVGSDHRRARD